MSNSNIESVKWVEQFAHVMIKKMEMHVPDYCACDSCHSESVDIWCSDEKEDKKRKIEEEESQNKKSRIE